MESLSALSAAPVARVIITGPSGAGKTTVGVELARLLGWSFVDLDDTISASAGRSVAAIFAEDGEDGWRFRETAALRLALQAERVVIATGAGIVERPENRALAAEARAWTLALDVSPEVALDRIRTQAGALGISIGELRPMLAGPEPLARLCALHARRAPFYLLADDVVRANDVMPDQIAARALAGLVVAGRRAADEAKAYTCHIAAGAGYEVITGWDALASLPNHLSARKLPARLSIVTDASVGALYAEPLIRQLRRAGFEPETYTIPAGEESKSRASLDAIHDWLAERRAERGEALLALGGGVVGDLAGFAAATWLRGVPLIQLPTSLLAQVDASIGGKVAIDHPRGKNLIGAFYQPSLVVADTATLLTLPDRQRIEGWAEVIKHGVALDQDYFVAIERDVEALLTVRPAEITAIIARSVAIKGAITSGDEREREGGRRALLNFGHTLGHAIETVTGYRTWLHGEAVSMGMVFAARLGVRLGVTPVDVAERLESLLSRFGLPTRLNGLSASDLLGATLWDKKARGGQVRWVLLTALGSATLYGSVPEDALRATLVELGAIDDASNRASINAQ
jgi:shikimate kinase/3-dehydroquinate synthase